MNGYDGDSLELIDSDSADSPDSPDSLDSLDSLDSPDSALIFNWLRKGCILVTKLLIIVFMVVYIYLMFVCERKDMA